MSKAVSGNKGTRAVSAATAAANVAHGGKTVYGACVGILMLDTRFPRIPGDIGNAGTWPFPVLYKVVRGASPDNAVRQCAADNIDRFIAAAHDLVADGADGITTGCGFLSLLQEPLAEALAVPVATSSLMQVSLVNRILPPGKRAGIVTIEKASITEQHLRAAGVPLDTPVVGVENGCEFCRVILDDEPQLDVQQSRTDLLAAGADLLRRHPEVGAIVLECTNMPPFAADMRRTLGVPIYSIYTFVQWFQAGLQPRRFAPFQDAT